MHFVSVLWISPLRRTGSIITTVAGEPRHEAAREDHHILGGMVCGKDVTQNGFGGLTRDDDQMATLAHAKPGSVLFTASTLIRWAYSSRMIRLMLKHANESLYYSRRLSRLPKRSAKKRLPFLRGEGGPEALKKPENHTQ